MLSVEVQSVKEKGGIDEYGRFTKHEYGGDDGDDGDEATATINN